MSDKSTARREKPAAMRQANAVRGAKLGLAMQRSAARQQALDDEADRRRQARNPVARKAPQEE